MENDFDSVGKFIFKYIFSINVKFTKVGISNF